MKHVGKQLARPANGARKPFRIFAPILAGANLRDRLLACLGALVAIAVAGSITRLALTGDANIPLIVAPMGASAVLLFAVPTSPMAQPWPTIGGNVISALVGVTVAYFVPNAILATGLAVGLAIVAMSLTRCLHPPGGAAALTAALGGPAVTSAGFLFPFFPVGLNVVFMVAVAWAFHRLCGRSYPHVPPQAAPAPQATRDPPPLQRVGFRPEDIDRALEEIGEAFDISRDDLENLIREVEMRALVRSHGDVSCADIMSRDMVSVTERTTAAEARAILLDRGLRVLPVLDSDGGVVGVVGLRELQGPGDRVGPLKSDAVLTAPDRPALELVEPLTRGSNHAALVVDENRRLLGLVSQTDLLAAMSKRSPIG